MGRLWRLLTSLLPGGALLLAVLTFGSYLMGLVRDRIFARTFGAGPELDAYNAAFVLPELALDVLVAGGLVAPFVPIFTGLKGRESDAAAAFGRAILTLSVCVMAVAAALLFAFAPQTVTLIAPGFSETQRELYVGLFRVMCVTPVIFATSIVLGEVLISEQRFLTYGLAPVLYNGGIVAGTVLLSSRIGIYAAALGALAGAVAHLTIRVVGILRTSFRPRPTLRLRATGVGEFLRLMAPKMASHPIEPLTFLYFTSLASTLAPGSVSSVSFARNFQSVPVSLIGASFAIAAFPALSVAAASGDRPGFRRIFRTNLASILVLTSAAAVALIGVSGFAIRLLLGGGAFDEDDAARTTAVLAIFAISIPLESLTHLLSRALYATRNTLLPSLASVAGFVATVIGAGALAPRLGLAAIPASFAIGMAVKVALLGVSLAPRMARIGVLGSPPATSPRTRSQRPGRLDGPSLRRRMIIGAALVALAIGAVAAGAQAIAGSTLAVAPSIAPWTRERPPAATPPVLAAPTPRATPTPSPSTLPSASPTPKPTPKPTPGPFAMDLYEKGDYAREYRDTWCLPAAMQTSMNIMDKGADVSVATQLRLFNLARSLVPDREGGAEPEAWALGLAKLGYGSYRVSVQPTLRAAIQLAAKQIRLTNRPAGLMVWRGVHAWVMSGFASIGDPAAGRFTVTAVRIEDVWYPRLSSIWGYSRPPDALVPVGRLPEDFLPWYLKYDGPHPDKDGRFVIVIPVAG